MAAVSDLLVYARFTFLDYKRRLATQQCNTPKGSFVGPLI